MMPASTDWLTDWLEVTQDTQTPKNKNQKYLDYESSS